MWVMLDEEEPWAAISEEMEVVGMDVGGWDW